MVSENGCARRSLRGAALFGRRPNGYAYSDHKGYFASAADAFSACSLFGVCRPRHLEHRFVTEGGIKERMHAARTGYRQQQDAHMRALEVENQQLKTEIAALKQRIEELLGGNRKA